MGIRVHKDIGYFLNKDKAQELFVDNYATILEDYDYNDDGQNVFWNNVQNLANTLDKDAFLARLNLKQLLADEPEKRLKSYQVISEITFGDDFMGVLFRNKNLFTTSRSDDTIDFYENNQEDSIHYLHTAIYPNSGYIYQGGLDDFIDDIEPLEVGQNVLEFLSLYARIINDKFYNEQLDYEKDFKRLLTEKKFFTPYVDNSIFILAKASGILRPEVSADKFNASIEPAILTYWC